jgi:hypothetical protein
MAERTFRSPGFFDAEIDLSQRQKAPLGTPAGIVGTAEKGPAFVPISIGSLADFKTKFGNLDSKKFGPYAVSEFLKNRNAVTYVRTLGAGVVTSSNDIENERTKGNLPGAGFFLNPTPVVGTGVAAAGHTSAMQFLVANHYISASETIGMPMFSDNDSFDNASAGGGLQVVRGMIAPAVGSRIMIASYDTSYAAGMNDAATIGPVSAGKLAKRFKVIVSSSLGSSFANDDGFAGIKIYTASLDPDDSTFISKVLNTDPQEFNTKKHYLHASFDVDAQLAQVSSAASAVGILSGSDNTNKHTRSFLSAYGQFNAAYTTPITPSIISQPFGVKEFDLFSVEAISDGAYANSDIKISISNVRASTNPNSKFGSFTLQVRKFSDTDLTPETLEQYPNLSLDPLALNYVAKVIGTKKATFNFLASEAAERRMMILGKFPNMSSMIRIVESDDLKNGLVPKSALPFGFRGYALSRTSPHNNDFEGVNPTNRLLDGDLPAAAVFLSSSILPPVPFRFKSTSGELNRTPTYIGEKGDQEIANARFYWGVKFERNTSPYNANPIESANACIPAFAKFLGIAKQEVLVSGSNKDTFNNNKFTLARVALSPSASQWSQVNTSTVSDMMQEATYLRNGVVNSAVSGSDSALYTLQDPLADVIRLGMGSLLASGALTFNRFSNFNKFSMFMAGGWDGLNILDKNAGRMNDKATSTSATGGASSGFVSPGLSANMGGIGNNNSSVVAYKTAADILTDPFISNMNILSIPGIREPLVTDHAAKKTKDYSMAIFIMDIENYDDSGKRLFNDRITRPSVRKTKEKFEARTIDNNYCAVYFPDVIITTGRGQHVRTPPSVAALGALGYNDAFGFPWFAPAGFNRASLDFVKNVDVRLSKGDRDDLYDARINPIATFPQQGFVIFGQKTLQYAQSSLDRVNVRRLMLEIKRIIVKIAEGILFEPNTSATRATFIARSVPELALIQAQAGIESFNVVMDNTNNTSADVEQNKLNGRIVVVPTRAIEFIAIDFIITNSGVSFE